MKTPTKVCAYSSEKWQSQFGLIEFDMVIKLSRGRAGDIKHSPSIMILPFKQHAHFLQWLHHADSQLLPFVELHKQNLHLCFELTQAEIPTKEAVINISGKSCFSIGSYLVQSDQASHAKLKSYLKTVEPEEVWGCDLGRKKLAVLTNQSEVSQEKALMIGQEQDEWLDKKEYLYTHYQKAVTQNQYKKVPAQRVAYSQQFKRWNAQYQQQIIKWVQSFPWDQMKVLVLENLNGMKIGSNSKKSLGRGFNKRNALWLVKQVQEKIIHYAQQSGTLCVLIDPIYTSKQCPKCGTVPELFKKGTNRRGECYHCKCCDGTLLDADYVGALNIRKRLYFWVKHGKMPFMTQTFNSNLVTT